MIDKPTYRGRGPSVPEKVDGIIAEVYLDDPEQTIKEVMPKVHTILQLRGLQRRPGWPSESYIDKLVRKIRPSEEPSEGPSAWKLEDAWNLGALSQYPLPSEVIPLVLTIQQMAYTGFSPLPPDIKEGIKQMKYAGFPFIPFTIREALWIPHIWKNISLNTDTRDLPRILLFWAHKYALKERISETRNYRLDTTEFDRIITFHPVEYMTYPHIFEILQEIFGIDSAGLKVKKLMNLVGLMVDKINNPADLDVGEELKRIPPDWLYGIGGTELSNEERLLIELWGCYWYPDVVTPPEPSADLIHALKQLPKDENDEITELMNRGEEMLKAIVEKK